MLKRLPHFYDPPDAGELLLGIVGIFGRRLETTEQDLYRVLRAHHVETADNEGSRGFTATPGKRGDLDKIFALYLEALGGTSQLVQINPRFTVLSINARRLARIMVDQQTPLTAYFRQSHAKKLHQAYLRGSQPALEIVHGNLAAGMPVVTISGEDGWKVLKDEIGNLLERYRVEHAYFQAQEIQPGFVLELLLGRSPVSRFINDHLSPQTRKLLFTFDGGRKLDPALPEALTTDLNDRILRNPSFFRQTYRYFSSQPLPAAAWELAVGIYKDFLREISAAESPPQRRQERLEALERVQSVDVPSPAGDDRMRLNRLLLETAFPHNERQRPWGFQPRRIPSLKAVATVLVDGLNRMLEKEDLYRKDRFPEMAETYPSLEKRLEGNPLLLNRLLLESAFPDEIEKSYVPYRERLRGLIRVLRRGASTRRGIVDIVAANLGIVGSEPRSLAARAQIQIEEFLPRQTSFFTGRLSFYQEFQVTNPNPGREFPEIRLIMLECPVRKLANIRIVDVKSGKMVRFPGRMETGDRLVFKGSSLLLNGIVPAEGVVGEVPVVQPATTIQWRFEADVAAEDFRNRPVGRFDATNFMEAPSSERHAGAVFIFDQPAVALEVVSYVRTPGVFTVTIPWHIPGFTDKFAETPDHPRHQILSLLNPVKAAGVQALVAYQQVFSEIHDHSVDLRHKLAGIALRQAHDMEDDFEIDSRQTAGETHDVGDGLVLSGCFDYTRYDSGNTFA